MQLTVYGGCLLNGAQQKAMLINLHVHVHVRFFCFLFLQLKLLPFCTSATELKQASKQQIGRLELYLFNVSIRRGNFRWEVDDAWEAGSLIFQLGISNRR